MINDIRNSIQEKLDFDLSLFLQKFEHDEHDNEEDLYQLIKDRQYQKLHHEICKKMFDEAEKSKEIWIRIDEQDDAIDIENIEKP